MLCQEAFGKKFLFSSRRRGGTPAVPPDRACRERAGGAETLVRGISLPGTRTPQTGQRRRGRTGHGGRGRLPHRRQAPPGRNGRTCRTRVRSPAQSVRFLLRLGQALVDRSPSVPCARMPRKTAGPLRPCRSRGSVLVTPGQGALAVSQAKARAREERSTQRCTTGLRFMVCFAVRLYVYVFVSALPGGRSCGRE